MEDRCREVLESLRKHMREAAVLESVEELLGWDERTYLPAAGGSFRAEQLSYLAGQVHRQRTDPRIGEWLDALADSPAAEDPHSDTGATVRRIRRDYDRQQKLPQTLVEELSHAAVLGQQAWTTARQANDFASFAPHLERILKLKRQQAEAWGYAEEPYDALLDDYEPGARTAHVGQVLADLRGELAPLVAEIADCGRAAPVEILHRSYPVAVQQRIVQQAATEIGFDFQRGRLDITHHPFCAGLGPDDCRITTRYDERFFNSAFFGVMHEAGHGIYDQGLRGEHFGLPPGSFVSLGIHESQSRLWENAVGRSRGFWQYFFPIAQEAFPEALSTVALDEFVFAINDVRPSLIRVEADEATYNLHIIVRFELERAMMSGDLSVKDLPGAWNEAYHKYLGIQPKTDSEGVLQDIHWSAGLIGYFPTYSLGNLYAAEFFDAAQQELGELEPMFACGEFAGLRDWLRRQIHHRGQCYEADQLAERVTGRRLSHQPLMRYLRGKLGPLYGLSG
jgi:carboxypeptidase Taq